MSDKELKAIDSKDEKNISGGCIGMQQISSGEGLNRRVETRYCVYDRDYDRIDAEPILEGFKTLEEAKKAAEERGLSTKPRWKLLKKDRFGKAEKLYWESLTKGK